jgi:hypothetical protein
LSSAPFEAVVASVGSVLLLLQQQQHNNNNNNNSFPPRLSLPPILLDLSSSSPLCSRFVFCNLQLNRAA